MHHTDPDPLLLIDAAVIAELRDIMQEDFVDLLQDFIDDVPIQIDLLHSAIAAGNADHLYRVAHKFKSSCGSLGAPRLAELSRQLEQAGRLATLEGGGELLTRTQAVATETVAGLQRILQSTGSDDPASGD